MFSGLDRPPDCETLEYAWLVEIQLGMLTGRLTMPQVSKTLSNEWINQLKPFLFLRKEVSF